jgi:CAAX prenyl protease-like protein
MVALFAVEHDRPLVAAIAGAVYGLIALRQSVAAAIIAHAVTNLLLGLWVIYRGDWAFW